VGWPRNIKEELLKNRLVTGFAFIAVLGITSPAVAFRPLPLSAQEQKVLRDNFALCISKLKGPYTENFCVCADGKKVPVRGTNGEIGYGCKNSLFCAAFRAPWAEALAKERMYIGNLFSRDFYLWDSFPDHNDLVRGYILEKYLTETHPTNKLSRLRSYGGLSGVEYETPASARFFERYLSAPEFKDNRDFLLAYELQRRYLVREDLGQIDKVRAMSVRIQAVEPKFKPLRDAVHNQLSPGIVPQLAVYRDQLPPGSTRSQVEALITEIKKLTSLDEGALKSQLTSLQTESLRSQLASLLPAPNADPVVAISSLARLMVVARQTVAGRKVPPGDARRLIDLNITAAGVIQQRGNALLEGGTKLSVKQYLQLLEALSDATFGVGLLGEREHEAAGKALHDLASTSPQSREHLTTQLAYAGRAVEWSQANAVLAFAEVWAPWTFLIPEIASIRDDILRSSPLLLYAKLARRLDEYAAGGRLAHHDIFGTEVDLDVRALNPGLALGRLRVAPKDGAYSRDEIVALPDTPADLDPAAGILTQGEGNVLSHVQLLARALGIPNVVLGASTYQKIVPHDRREVFLIVTPRGRVVIKEASSMTSQDKAVYEEYTRNQTRAADGSLGNQAPRLHIDRTKTDLSKNMPINLKEVRRRDSGRFCGPKAAYLGELKHLFPEQVARGIVVPFGAYYDHYRNAKVVVPDKLRALGIATPGERLPDFAERTYREFFAVMIPAKKSEKDLSVWITPRLDIIRYSIRQQPLTPSLKQAIRDGLDREGLLVSHDKSQTVGCFVRSDTNVEDLDNFNGAGLNLTVFNRKSLEEIYEGLKEVWASPFEFRSFSWRQTLIDDPIWVLTSVVILESVPNDKSGVLITADINTGDPGKMTVATSEGVGGAVDGTSAETLLWSPHDIELVTLFKSPWKNQLLPGGGSAIVASSGKDTVLEPDELKQIVLAGQKISANFEPARDPLGKTRPWDIEFGFKSGKLWLFQCRPFLGDDALKNIPALASLETPRSGPADNTRVSLEEVLR
jgi:pyruvate phosphate dikinase-like enzyme